MLVKPRTKLSVCFGEDKRTEFTNAFLRAVRFEFECETSILAWQQG